MDIALTQQHVRTATQFHFAAILRLVEHPIPHDEGPDVGAYRDDFRPHEAATHLGRRRDDDAASGSSFAIWPIGLHENSIVEQLDGKCLLVGDWIAHRELLVLVEDAPLDATKHHEAYNDPDGNGDAFGANAAILVNVERPHLVDLDRDDALGVERLLNGNLELSDVLNQRFA